jgi:hypothetical protein
MRSHLFKIAHRSPMNVRSCCEGKTEADSIKQGGEEIREFNQFRLNALVTIYLTYRA